MGTPATALDHTRRSFPRLLPLPLPLVGLPLPTLFIHIRLHPNNLRPLPSPPLLLYPRAYAIRSSIPEHAKAPRSDLQAGTSLDSSTTTRRNTSQISPGAFDLTILTPLL